MSRRFIVFMFVSLTEPDPHDVLEATEGLCRITGQRTRGLGGGHAGTLMSTLTFFRLSHGLSVMNVLCNKLFHSNIAWHVHFAGRPQS